MSFFPSGISVHTPRGGKGLYPFSLGSFVKGIRPLEVWISDAAAAKVGLSGRSSPARGRITLQGGDDPFVHVFLFQCGDCGAPVATASASAARNLEQMDARSFSLACDHCGWSGRSIGTAAKRHWVDF